MIYHITHRTTYRYSDAVSLCHNVVHLIPRDTPAQECLSKEFTISPEPTVSWEGTDYFGNPTTFFTLQEPHRELALTAVHFTDRRAVPMPAVHLSPPWEEARRFIATGRSEETLGAYHFTFDSLYIKASAGLLEYAMPSFPPGRPMLQGAFDLMARIHRDFKYDPKATTISTPLQQVLATRRGVCQDFAHLMIGCFRALGLPGRYVSGYLRTMPLPGRPRLVGADASHAWVATYCPEHGWVDLDPTNNIMPSDQHVVLGWGRDYDDLSPIKGIILGGGQHVVTVGVDVVPQEESALAYSGA